MFDADLDIPRGGVSSAAMSFRFGEYVLDLEQHELRRDGARVPVEPQVLALLQHLVENRHRVVSKDELIERIWNGLIVSEAAIASRVKSWLQDFF